MTKKTNTKKATCTATASGGVIKCVLEPGHKGWHSSAQRGQKPKPAQHMEWTVLYDGRTQVTTFARGKRQSDWFEDAPKDSRPAASVCYCGGKDARGSHDLGHPKVCKVPDHEMCVCIHGKERTHMIGAPGCTSTPVPSATQQQATEELDADEIDDEVRSDEERDFARKMREDREAHANDLATSGNGAQGDLATRGAVLGDGSTGDMKQTAGSRLSKSTRIGDHEIHPAAALFPLIDGEEYEAFREDIRTNGQRKKIVRIGDLILDGRNRLRACLDLKIEPRFRTFGSDLGDGTDPIAFVVSENVARRHLNETQRAFVGAELVPMYEAQAKERMLAGKRKDPSPNSGEGRSGKATELAAKAVNVGKSSIEAALKVKREAAPEVLEAAKERGQIKVSTAAKLVELPKAKQQEIVRKIGGGELRSGKVRSLVAQENKRDVVRKINAQKVGPMPVGPFGVIYGDYPWHYDNSDQHEGSRGHLPYPTMKMEEILAHASEAAKRGADDCILALWTTNLYVTEMGQVLRAYGAERRTMFTWPKPRAGVGTWGRGQTEHLVIASIGSPVHTLNEVSTLLPSWKPEHPGEHSSKPAEVAALLAKHCGGPFLELFARDQRDGWTCWGAEVDKFATEAA